MTAADIPSAQSDPLGSDEAIIAQTRAWIEKAVIGLDLCPFAQAVHASNRIRYRVSDVQSTEALLEHLRAELRALQDADPKIVETVLLIHPQVLNDFYEYNAFLDDAEEAVHELDLTGVLQVASFHPHYQFADTAPDDIENYTNRSPYPMLHLLRESSVERAVATMGDPAEIYEKNIETLRNLGHEGWRLLWLADRN
jgi:uncharacterized protein